MEFDDYDELSDEELLWGDPDTEELFRRIYLGREKKSETTIINPKHYLKFMTTYNQLNEMIKGQNVKLTYELRNPLTKVSTITLEGKTIFFKDPDKFTEIMKKACNFEVYPLCNGDIRLCLMMDRVFVPIK